MNISIIGAGMSGLLAGNMLRASNPKIFEQQARIPNNHKALLRFRSSAVGDAIGTPFKEVSVMKGVHMEGFHSSVAASLSYGMKVANSSGFRSIVTALNGEISKRFIAPEDFIQTMERGLTSPVQFNVKVNRDFLETVPGEFISTLPMKVLADLLGYEFKKSKFGTLKGFVIRADVDVDVYATVYLPSMDDSAYRVSITGSKLIVEYLGEIFNYTEPAIRLEVVEVLKKLGLETANFTNVEVFEMPYAKILPIDENERKKFIMWATEKHGIYSLGRFAVWKPGLLMDDVVNDVRVIQKMLSGEANNVYQLRKQ